MKILYVTADNSSSTASENNGFYLRQALVQAGVDLVPYGSAPLSLAEKLILGGPKLLVERLGREIRASLVPWVLNRRARELTETVDRVRPDVVLANSPAVLYGLKTSVPQVLYSDAPVSALIGMGHYYDTWIGWFRHKFVAIDREVLSQVKIAIYHSQWAARQASRNYALPASRFRSILPGANLPYIDAACAAVERPRTLRCDVLFWGRDWERKGGPEAIAIVEAMRQAGVDAHLTICGPNNLGPDVVDRSFLSFHGYLKKETPEQLASMRRLFQRMDYVLLPTHADASTAAIREGAAFGVPSIVTNIGGLGELVEHGVSGLLMEAPCSPLDVAAAIIQNWTDDEKRLTMRRNARSTYETSLNWSVATAAIMKEMGNLVPA